MTNAQRTLPGNEDPSHIKTHDMYKRIMTVAELLKKSAHQQPSSEETMQPEHEKTQDSKAVVS